jgi:hypothetical protein
MHCLLAMEESNPAPPVKGKAHSVIIRLHLLLLKTPS